MDLNKSFMLIFLASETFFFIALIISYGVYSHAGGALSSSTKHLDIVRAAIFSLFLFSSSLTIQVAAAKMDTNKRKKILSWLFITIVFGAIFLVGQITEYAKLIKLDITISKNVFGSAFFTLTGFHGVHVLIGLIALSILFGLIFSGKFKSIETTAFKSTALYWHFVDGVWVVIFSVVYVWAIIQ